MHLCSQAREWLTLYFLPGLGCTVINKLVQSGGSVANVLQVRQDLEAQPGIGPKTISLLKDSALVARARRRAEQEITNLEKNNISLVSVTCEEYPPLLKEIPDPPSLVFYSGSLLSLARPCIAIVGSRNASEYGKKIARMFAGQLSANGFTIISGGAHGIDSSAHLGALQYGETAAVFGCGLDVFYPVQNKELFQQISTKGVLLSEYPLGTRPDKFRFPARNRIISGLSKGVLVVEATAKSGSLITAHLALDQGRDVWAVPGRVDSLKSNGCHKLIQTGAQLAQHVDDIMESLHMQSCCPEQSPQSIPEHGDTEKQLLSCMDVYPMDIDTLLRLTGLPINELYTALLNLEMQGHIRQLPGQLYELNTLP